MHIDMSVDENNPLHTKEFHLKNLQEICRTCGRRSLTKKDIRKYSRKSFQLCENFKDGILFGFGVDISDDHHMINSSTICYMCTSQLKNFAKPSTKPATIEKAKASASSLQRIWVPYQEDVSIYDCNLCSHFKATTQGGKQTNVSTERTAKGSILKGELMFALTIQAW